MLILEDLVKVFGIDKGTLHKSKLYVARMLRNYEKAKGVTIFLSGFSERELVTSWNTLCRVMPEIFRRKDPAHVAFEEQIEFLEKQVSLLNSRVQRLETRR